MFSILIPSWNNLELLKLCVRSIQQNSAYPHQIIIHINDGSDGSLEWVREQQLSYTHSPENIGICLAVNEAAMHARLDYILYLNDDMYCCPGWDSALVNKMECLGTDFFMLSGTMIEPVHTWNPCVVVKDYGRSPEEFAAQDLLANLSSHHRPDWYGATWPPTLVPAKWWFRVGGYSSEFSPGMSSDNDFSMKLWHAGCRVFLGVGNSLVYHFQAKSTGRIKKNNGGKQFLHKWGIRQSVFDHYYLRRGAPAGGITLAEPEDTLSFRWQLVRGSLKRRLG